MRPDASATITEADPEIQERLADKHGHNRLCWWSRGSESPMSGACVSHRDVRGPLGLQTPSARPRFGLNQQSQNRPRSRR